MPKSPPQKPKTTTADSGANRLSRWRIARFVVLFTLLVSLAAASELFLQRCQAIPSENATNSIRASIGRSARSYQTIVAKAVVGVTSALGMNSDVIGTTIRIKSARVDVALECTGIKATAIFCAGVLAFPCVWRAKALGIAMGLIGVGILNVGRITVLAWVAGYHHDSFDQVHAVLMQGFLILFVAPLWILWMFTTNRPADNTQSAQSSATKVG